ncbi:MAG: DUF1003 domain-containing protein [Acidobacteriota bacterium]|nr:DUF1003 domain-containing protein [Acidobacteriota bacterium]
MKKNRPSGPSSVESNIRAISEMQANLEENRGLLDKLADVIASFSGSITFVLLHVAWFVLWFLWNTGVFPGVKRFDPYPFILLAMIVSVEGVLLSTFVLMKQNRMQRRSDARDHVNLQIDLLAEKEVTKALRLLQAVCRKLEISDAEADPELDEMMAVTSVDTLAGDVRAKLLEEKKES